MIDLVTFSGGLSVMALQLKQPATAELLKAYHLALEDETDADEWMAFYRVAVKRFGWTFLPSVPELLAALSEFRGAPAVDQEAAAAYQRVLESGTWTMDGGTYWDQRTVAEKCGRAAAEAFMAAGGHHAFATTWDESKRRERFIRAYQQAALDRPDARLLPAGEQPKALPAPDEPMTLAEARSFLEQIRAHLPPGVEMPKPTREAVVVTADPERVAMLKRQAAEIVAGADQVQP